MSELSFACGFPLPPPNWSSWEELMVEALGLAQQAALQNEVPVGAIVIDDSGKIIGRGINCPLSTCNPCAHAEIMALQNAGRQVGNYRLLGAYLVTTLEPCLMCSGAIIHARLQGLVFGAYDDKAGAIATKMNSLSLPFHNHKLPWLGGILKQQCAEILSDFFRQKREATLARKL